MIDESKIQEAIVKIIREHFDCGTLTYQGEAHKIAAKIQDIFDIQLTHELNEQGKGWAEDFLEYTKAMESLKDDTVKDVYKKLGAYVEQVLKCSESSNEYKISALLYYAQALKYNKEG